MEVNLPLAYQEVVGKIVLPKWHKGTIRVIGYGGVLVEVKHGLKEHANVLLKFELALTGGSIGQIYAKVRRVRHDHGHRLAGVAFTSVSEQVDHDVRSFVQMLIQGTGKQ